MMEKLVQSVKLKSLSVYRLKIVKAASSIEGVTVTISMKPLFFMNTLGDVVPVIPLLRIEKLNPAWEMPLLYERFEIKS